MFVFLGVLIGLFGAAIGSFLNVVIYRVPLGKSIVSPPSACGTCGEHVRWYDNIPVLSWFILRGKCRWCGAPFSVRYALVEAGTGIFFVVVGATVVSELLSALTAQELFAVLLKLIALLYLASISVALAMIDLDTHTLPNTIVLPSYIVGAALIAASTLLAGDYDALLRAGIGLIGTFVFYFAVTVVYPAGMGMGDVKLSGVLGLFLAWQGWGAFVVGSFAPFVLGGLFAIVLLVSGRARRKTRIPFGPWMLAGAWIGIFGGEFIGTWYLTLFDLV